MEPQYDYTNAQVYLVAEFPETWSFTDSWYTGSVGGVQVNGPGTFLPSDPGVCSSMGPVPDGYQRVFITEGPFSGLSPDTGDHAEAQLRFDTGSTDGTYQLRFWSHVVDVGGETCDDDNPLPVLVSESPEWEQVVGASVPVAFGNHWGFIDDLAGFDGSVYVQVLTSTDAQVWRSSDLGTWEQAFGWSWPLMSLEAPRFSRPAVVGGRLFIGLSDSDQGPSPDACRIWSTGDGLNWELSLEEDPPCRLHALFEYQGLVYAVIDSPLRLVRSQGGSNWTTVAFFPADAYWVYTTQSFGGAMYLGGRSLDPGGDRLWRFNGTELSAVGQTLESCDFVFATTAFRNELYLGCYGATGEVWSTPDGESWQLIVDDGFSAGNVRVAGLAAHQVRLFAWSDDWPAGGNLWSTDNLVDWEGSLLSEVIRGDGLTDLRVVGPRLLASSGGSLWQLRPLFADGFETGDLSVWSQSVP